MSCAKLSSYFRSMMSYSYQASLYSSTLIGNKTDLNVRATQFPEFFIQIALGGMNVLEVIPNVKDSTHVRLKSFKWNNEQNLVLLSGRIKYRTFIQLIRLPQDLKASIFAKRKEVVRKDVECVFGILQARFVVIKNPAFFR